MGMTNASGGDLTQWGEQKEEIHFLHLKGMRSVFVVVSGNNLQKEVLILGFRLDGLLLMVTITT